MLPTFVGFTPDNGQKRNTSGLTEKEVGKFLPACYEHSGFLQKLKF